MTSTKKLTNIHFYSLSRERPAGVFTVRYRTRCRLGNLGPLSLGRRLRAAPSADVVLNDNFHPVMSELSAEEKVLVLKILHLLP